MALTVNEQNVILNFDWVGPKRTYNDLVNSTTRSISLIFENTKNEYKIELNQKISDINQKLAVTKLGSQETRHNELLVKIGKLQNLKIKAQIHQTMSFWDVDPETGNPTKTIHAKNLEKDIPFHFQDNLEVNKKYTLQLKSDNSLNFQATLLDEDAFEKEKNVTEFFWRFLKDPIAFHISNLPNKHSEFSHYNFDEKELADNFCGLSALRLSISNMDEKTINEINKDILSYEVLSVKSEKQKLFSNLINKINFKDLIFTSIGSEIFKIEDDNVNRFFRIYANDCAIEHNMVIKFFGININS